MNLVLGGGRTMALSQEGGDTRPGAQMGAGTQVGRRFREGPAWSWKESHTGFVRGLPQFLQWAPRHSHRPLVLAIPSEARDSQALAYSLPSVGQPRVHSVLANTLEGGVGWLWGTRESSNPSVCLSPHS